MNPTLKPLPTAVVPCSFWRLMAVILYDGLLMFGLIFIANWLLLLLLGSAISGSGHPLIFIYTLTVCYLFLGGFWTYSGQTLGMQAWRVKLISTSGGRISWGQATVRFTAALLSWGCCGLGFLWLLIDPQKQSWHDHLSRSVLTLVTPHES